MDLEALQPGQSSRRGVQGAARLVPGTTGCQHHDMDAVPVLTFNDLLLAGGLELRGVRLVRHREVRHGRAADAALRAAALRLDPAFLAYQTMHGGPSYGDANHIAAFTFERGVGTVFIGAWSVAGVGRGPTFNAFARQPASPTEGVVYDLRHVPAFDPYRGRLVIDWGEGFRAWVQHASRQPKPIVALLPRVQPPFPGWARLALNLADIAAAPEAWRQVLAAARGVYLVVHRTSGTQYVGAAHGEGGFLARWTAYADGHAGNLGLRELARPPEEYDVSVLWLASSKDSEDDVLAQEAFEKERLGSRVHGLNRN
jgi:hypothetical protein